MFTGRDSVPPAVADRHQSVLDVLPQWKEHLCRSWCPETAPDKTHGEPSAGDLTNQAGFRGTVALASHVPDAEEQRHDRKRQGGRCEGEARDDRWGHRGEDADADPRKGMAEKATDKIARHPRGAATLGCDLVHALQAAAIAEPGGDSPHRR